MYYENYILINIEIPNFEEIKKKYFDNEGSKIVLINDNYSIQSPFKYFTPVMNADPDGHFTILGLLIGMTIGVAFAGTASLIGDFANNGKMFDGDINYMRNMAIGGVIGLLSLGISPLLGIVFYFGYVMRDLYTSLTNDADLRFDEQNKVIYNSYRTISYDEKLKYIRDNDIAKKMNKTEFEILLEWDLHNLAYYLDIFGLLRERSKDLNIG